MRSARKNSIAKTLRFRLALLHVLLVSVALLTTFVISLLLVKSFMEVQEQKTMGHTLQHAQRLYFGEEPPETPLMLPPETFQRLETEVPGFHIGIVDREEGPGGWVYEVIGSSGSEQMEVFIEPKGRIWIAKRVPMADLFQQMESILERESKHPLSLFILSPEGTPLAGKIDSGSPVGELLPELLRQAMEDTGPALLSNGNHWVGLVRLYDGNLAVVAESFGDVSGAERLGVRLFAILALLFLPLSGGIGYYISRKAMAGVERVAETARRVQGGRLGERVTVGNEGYEIESLATAFNEMLGRIESLMEELQGVTTNIAHDLRTPMARIRGLVESLEWRELSPEKHRQTIGNILEECDRIMPLTEAILELARLEAERSAMKGETIDLAAEVRTACALFSEVAEDRGIALSCSIPAAPLPLACDRSRTQRAISNLIDNALKFTPKGGEVRVSLETEEDRAVLRIADNGPGIPPKEIERVFERFYRVDPSRNTPGNGLGLSMVRAYAQACGGEVEIVSKPGNGCTVCLMLPLAQ